MNSDPTQNPRQLPRRLPVLPVDLIHGERNLAEPDPQQSSTERTGPDPPRIVGYWKIVRRHKGTVVVIGLLGGVAGFLYTVPQTPIYQAHTSVEVVGLNGNFLNIRDVDPTSTASLDSRIDIRTQVSILESDSLRDRTIQKLRAKNETDVVYPTDRLSAWKKVLHLESGEPMTRDGAIGLAARTVAAKDSGATRIIDVTCESADPKLAADCSNTLVSEFIAQDLESRLNSSELTGEWLTRQLADLKIKLEKSEDQLQAYAATVGLQFAGAGGGEKDGVSRENVADEKLRQLQAELLKAEGDRVTAQSQFELLMSSSVDSVSQGADQGSLRGIQAKLTDLRRQLADLSTTRTTTNYKVLQVQAQIDELESALKKERQTIASRIRDDFDGAQRRERMISDKYSAQTRLVNQQAGKAIHYNILKREVDTNRQIYEAMLQKVKEAGIASAMRASSFRVVDPAKVPSLPFRPNASRAVLLGLTGGFLGGIAFVVARQREDRNFQEPGELAFYLNLPELGVIANDKAGSQIQQHQLRFRMRANPLRLSLRKERVSRRITPSLESPRSDHQNGMALATWKRNSSLLAESIHATLTSILFSARGGNQPKVLIFSSAGPGEGKSMLTSNLGMALAEINRKVLVIDGDMRQPRLSEFFAVSNERGLSTLLKEPSTVSDDLLAGYIVETQMPGLFFLPSGPSTSNVSNLLYSPRFEELLRYVRNRFDTILIDSPPMLQLADARVMGQHCDAVILVVRAGKTTIDAAIDARKRFEQDGTPILGTILNDWNPRVNGYGYGDKYYEKYAKYYQST